VSGKITGVESEKRRKEGIVGGLGEELRHYSFDKSIPVYT
jgi:hypothetical protein